MELIRLENGPKRNIYAITTDKGEYKIYTKYVVNREPKILYGMLYFQLLRYRK